MFINIYCFNFRQDFLQNQNNIEKDMDLGVWIIIDNEEELFWFNWCKETRDAEYFVCY